MQHCEPSVAPSTPLAADRGHESCLPWDLVHVVRCSVAMTAIASIIVGCGGSSSSAANAPLSPASGTPALLVESPDLAGGTVAREVTCDGANRAPSVRWSASPTASAAVVELLDPDAPGGTFVHWLAIASGADAASGVLHTPAVEGRNDFGANGYGGPCPPSGQTHHYHLVVTTYGTPLNLASGFTAADLNAAVSGHAALGRGEVVGSYGR